MAAGAAAGGLSKQPDIVVSADYVGNEFIKCYYDVLEHHPAHCHRFYKDDSSMTVSFGKAGDMDFNKETVTTTLGIQEKVRSSVQGAMVKVESKASSFSASHGVLLQVTGKMGLQDKTYTFCQTFFLAPQDMGYYILTDILALFLLKADEAKSATRLENGYISADALKAKKPLARSEVQAPKPAHGPVDYSATNGHALAPPPATAQPAPPVYKPAATVQHQQPAPQRPAAQAQPQTAAPPAHGTHAPLASNPAPPAQPVATHAPAHAAVTTAEPVAPLVSATAADADKAAGGSGAPVGLPQPAATAPQPAPAPEPAPAPAENAAPAPPAAPLTYAQRLVLGGASKAAPPPAAPAAAASAATAAAVPAATSAAAPPAATPASAAPPVRAASPKAAPTATAAAARVKDAAAPPLGAAAAAGPPGAATEYKRGSQPGAGGANHSGSSLGGDAPQDQAEVAGVFLRNLPKEVTEAEVQEEFKRFGAISRVTVVNRRELPVNAAYVDFAERESVVKATAVGEVMLGGIAIRVLEKRPATARGAPYGGRGRGGDYRRGGPGMYGAAPRGYGGGDGRGRGRYGEVRERPPSDRLEYGGRDGERRPPRTGGRGGEGGGRGGRFAQETPAERAA